MPLLPLPPSNTKRYFLGIIGPDAEHHVQIRVAETVADGAAVSDIGYLANLIAPVTYINYSFHELLVSQIGSDIRNPVAGWVIIPGTDALNQPVTDHPLSITGRGRSSTGRKTRFSLWGQVFIRDEDWMYQPAALSPHETFLFTVNSSPTYFLANDGTKPVWRADYTVQYNDHWVKQERP